MIRRYVVLVIGIAALVAGCVVRFWPRPTGFGWTAYNPLSDSSLIAQWQLLDNLALALIVVGTALTAGWIGHRLGRRGPSDAA